MWGIIIFNTIRKIRGVLPNNAIHTSTFIKKIQSNHHYMIRQPQYQPRNLDVFFIIFFRILFL